MSGVITVTVKEGHSDTGDSLEQDVMLDTEALTTLIEVDTLILS